MNDKSLTDEIEKNGKFRPLMVDDEIIGFPLIERGEKVGIMTGVSQYDFGPTVVAIPLREKFYRTIGIATCKDRELSSAAREFKSVLISTAEKLFK